MLFKRGFFFLYRAHAVPNSLFDYKKLGYGYDNLNIGGYNIEQIETMLTSWNKRPRVLAGFLLKGIKKSGTVLMKVCKVR